MTLIRATNFVIFFLTLQAAFWLHADNRVSVYVVEQHSHNRNDDSDRTCRADRTWQSPQEQTLCQIPVRKWVDEFVWFICSFDSHWHIEVKTKWLPFGIWLQSIGQRQLQDDTRNIQVWRFVVSYTRCLTVMHDYTIQPTLMYTGCIYVYDVWNQFYCWIHGSKAISAFNTLRPRQDGRHFPDDIFKWIFLNENV